tara:strand:- start:5404 stop:5583 length:180 start_codon:yes stop_codon:yes gene_type:complete
VRIVLQLFAECVEISFNFKTGEQAFSLKKNRSEENERIGHVFDLSGAEPGRIDNLFSKA